MPAAARGDDEAEEQALHHRVVEVDRRKEIEQPVGELGERRLDEKGTERESAEHGEKLHVQGERRGREHDARHARQHEIVVEIDAQVAQRARLPGDAHHRHLRRDRRAGAQDDHDRRGERADLAEHQQQQDLHRQIDVGVEHVHHHRDDDHAQAAGAQDHAGGCGDAGEIHLAQERFEDRRPAQMRQARGDVER